MLIILGKDIQMSMRRMVVGVGSHLQNKLRLALGTMKDHASIGKAMLCRSLLGGGGGGSSDDGDGWYSSGIEIAVVRATGHDSAPIDDKHMHEILFLVSNAPPGSSVPFLAERISHRLHKTRDRNVALKTLMLVHRLLRGGDSYFEQDLRHAYLSGHLQIMINKQRWRGCRRRRPPPPPPPSPSCCRNTESRKKKYDYRKNEDYGGGCYSNCGGRRHYSSSSSPPAQQQQQQHYYDPDDDGDDDDPSTSFLLNYAAFLEERMGWVINQAGKLEPIMFQEEEEEEEELMMLLEYHHHHQLDKSMVTVFRRLPKYQAFLDRVLDCSPALPLLLLLLLPSSIDDNHEEYPSHRLIRAAMNNILKETFQVYSSFCEALATLLDSFFDFKYPSATLLALQLLKTASRLTYQLSDFFLLCKRIVGTKNLDYPTVQLITSDYVSAMEPFLFSSSSPPPTTSPSPPPPFCDYFSDPDLGWIKAKPTQVTLTIPRAKKIGQEEEEEEEVEKGTDHNGTSPSPSPSSASSNTPSSCRLMETKISKVWVVFDDEEESSPQNSNYSIGCC